MFGGFLLSSFFFSRLFLQPGHRQVSGALGLLHQRPDCAGQFDLQIARRLVAFGIGVSLRLRRGLSRLRGSRLGTHRDLRHQVVTQVSRILADLLVARAAVLLSRRVRRVLSPSRVFHGLGRLGGFFVFARQRLLRADVHQRRRGADVRPRRGFNAGRARVRFRIRHILSSAAAGIGVLRVVRLAARRMGSIAGLRGRGAHFFCALGTLCAQVDLSDLRHQRFVRLRHG